MSALIALAVSLAPEIARWLSGDDADKTTAAVSHAVETITGSTDPDVASAMLQKDPGVATQLRLRLAQVAAECEKASRSADMDRLVTALRDTADARAQTVTLAGQKVATAWSTPVISALVLVTFASIMAVVLLYGLPTGSETAATMLLGTLAAMATSVVSYWVGSSAGSARKDERLAQAGR